MTQSGNGNSACLGAAYMTGAGLLFAIVNTLVQTVTMRFAEPSTAVAFWQYVVALIFFLPWIIIRLRTALSTSQLPLHALRVVFAVAGVQAWVLGLAHVPIGQAVALIMTSPFFVMLGAWLILKEPLTLQRWMAVAMGFAGGTIILSPWSDSFTAFSLYPLAASVLWGMSSVTTKLLTRTEAPETLTMYLLVFLTPFNALIATTDGIMLTSVESVWIVGVAGALTAAAQFVIAKAYSSADAAYLQPFDHLKLPFNVLLGWLAFGFLPVGGLWLGAILIVGATLYLLSSEARPLKPRNPRPSPYALDLNQR